MRDTIGHQFCLDMQTIINSKHIEIDMEIV